MNKAIRIGFIGGGMMAGGIIDGLVRRGQINPGAIVVCEPVAARRAELSDRFGVSVTTAYTDALATDVVVLAVKPQEFDVAAADIGDALVGNPLLISIMAGVPIKRMMEFIRVSRAVRVMPNLGAIVGESFSTWYGTPGLSDEDRATVQTLLGAIGPEHEVSAERYLDMATAVAGSGPGYITLLIEALIDGAVQIGLPRPLATEMVLQTMLGTVRWAQTTGSHPAELRAQVVSPAGTTAAGVYALERGSIRATLIEAVIAGFERSRALGS